MFVGFGSMPIIDPAATMDMITTVAARVGARVLIGAGWSRFGQHQAHGDRVRVVTGVLNYDRVLPRCRVAVHHGGSGTVAASVAAGIPTFVCSLVADNPFWGARVEQLGIGVHERFADLNQDRLEAGLRRHCTPTSSPAPGPSATRCGRTPGPPAALPTSSRANCPTDRLHALEQSSAETLEPDHYLFRQ